MADPSEQQVDYLTRIIEDIQYYKERFKLVIGNDRYVMGVVSGSNFSDPAPFSKLMQYKTLYDTLKDLDYKIKFSLFSAIDIAYSDELLNNFNVMAENTEEEIKAYYFIENALFRIVSLWDILAQLYRLYYNINIPADKVYYKSIFNPEKDFSEKFKSKADEIHTYINEDDYTDSYDRWKGNHSYVDKCRNKMIHKNSPNIGTMSDYDLNIKSHPIFMLKRIVEDYDVVSHYLSEILNRVEAEETKNFESIAEGKE